MMISARGCCKINNYINLLYYRRFEPSWSLHQGRDMPRNQNNNDKS